MFKTLIKSWSSVNKSWGKMATISEAFDNSYHYRNSIGVKLYPGIVDILHQANHSGIIICLKAWMSLYEQHVDGRLGYTAKPLGIPDGSSFEDDRVVNLQNVASDRRMRFYLEFLKATRIFDEPTSPFAPPRKPSLLGIDWLSEDTAVLLDWADWHLLSRFSIPVRNVPIEIDLLSEVKSRDDLGYLPFVKGDIFGVRLLVDSFQDNHHLSFGDAISIVGSIVDEELE
ncbi:MAG: hypothetical protein AB4352_21280 [Hormoscilla sp.]